jgi:predicted Zn-dependent protease
MSGQAGIRGKRVGAILLGVFLAGLLAAASAWAFLDKVLTYGVSAVKVGTAVAKSAEDLTPEHEYYIGRAVAATILGKYQPLQNEAANAYLNQLGQALVQASDRPQTFGGYHFLVLDSDEINAFGCPGGPIVVSRGLLRCCTDEDQVASVLAHEIGHVSRKHGMASIEKSRIMDVGGVLFQESASHAGGGVGALAGAFAGSIGDITKTLMVNGYSRGQEGEADLEAVTILKRLGYDPRALIKVLATMAQRYQPGGADFAKTHPNPQDRINALEDKVAGYQAAAGPPARAARYKTALGNL